MLLTIIYLSTWLFILVATYLVISKKTEKMLLRLGGSFVVSLFIVVIVFSVLAKIKSAWEAREALGVANSAGFETIAEYEKAKKAGFKHITEYAAHRKSQEESARRARENKKQAMRADCRKDLRCWGNENIVYAAVECKDKIARLGNYDHEWTDGVFVPRYTSFRWKDQGRGFITYISDKLKFQNGFGAWQNVIYECDYDPAGDTVLDARVRQGRLAD